MGMRRAEIEDKFDEIVAFAEVEKFLDTPVKRYSSGMYVIVDEVLAVGDVQFQRKCLGKMEEVSSGEGRTILFVSHNMPAVQRFCSKVLHLEHGQVVDYGPTSEVVARYLQINQSERYHWQAGLVIKPLDARFIEIAVVGSDNLPASYVPTGGRLRIRAVFEILHPDPRLQLSIALTDENGSVICDSTPYDNGITFNYGCGVFEGTVAFPEDLLLSRAYGVRAMLWKVGVGVVDCVDDIRFPTIETESLGNSNPGGRPGMVALRCEWQVVRQGGPE